MPALVYTDASTSRINLENGISWQPGGAKILFTSNLPPGAANITQQLFTVPSAGGAPTQFFVPPEAPGDPVYRFGTPEWAPDGTRIAVWVQEQGTVQDLYLSVMTAGVEPVPLRAVHVIHPAAARPYWSTDGTALLYSNMPTVPGRRRPPSSPRQAGRRSGATPTAAITDWQPCPTGTCVVWGLHTARTLSLQASKKKVAKGKKVTFTGRGRGRGRVGLHGRSGGRPAEGGDRSARNLPPPGRGHDRRGRSLHGEGQGAQHGPLPGGGHRATGLPRRDVPRGQGQGEGQEATQVAREQIPAPRSCRRT